VDWLPTETHIKDFLPEYNPVKHKAYIRSQEETWILLTNTTFRYVHERASKLATTIEIEVRSIKDHSPNVSPNNTIKGRLNKVNGLTSINELDSYIQHSNKAANAEGSPVYLILPTSRKIVWSTDTTLISEADQKLGFGRNLFNLPLSFVDHDNDKITKDIIIDEQLWFDQLLRQEISTKLSSWFDEMLRQHIQYKQDLACLPSDALQAMQRYLSALKQFGKSPEITYQLDLNFDNTTWGIKVGYYFTAEQAAWCDSIRGPNGMPIQRMLAANDTRETKTERPCVTCLLIPIIEQTFFPKLELPQPRPQNLSVLSRIVESRLRIGKPKIGSVRAKIWPSSPSMPVLACTDEISKLLPSLISAEPTIGTKRPRDVTPPLIPTSTEEAFAPESLRKKCKHLDV